MYGLVNLALQELVTTQFGLEKWEAIKRQAGVEVVRFNRFQPYDDAVTYKLVGAASRVLDAPADDLMKGFGEFFVLFTGREGYGPLFDIAGKSLKGFLLKLDELHTRLQGNFSEMKAPSFTYDELSENVLRMHYHTERAGLCPLVVGLLQGLSKRFQTTMEVDHDVCKRTQPEADHCEFVLTLGGNTTDPS